MKKILITSVVAVLIGGAAFAENPTNVVTSANVVGYNQINVKSNVYVLIALNFSNANPTVSNLFAALPNGSEVIFWSTNTQAYSATIAKSRSGWGAGGSTRLEVGSGAFVKIPAVTNFYLSGDVLMPATTDIKTLSNKYALLSLPYSADMPFTNTALGKLAANGDSISVFGTNGAWTTYAKSRSGWGGATNVQLSVGQSIFYKAVTNRTVIEARPYTNSWN
jgi:hypothetical protein